MLVAVGAVTLLVVMIFIMPEPSADLEWIRRLGPIRETVGKKRVEEQMWGSFTTVERRFDFAGDEPSAAMIDAVNSNNVVRDVSNWEIGLPHN